MAMRRSHALARARAARPATPWTAGGHRWFARLLMVAVLLGQVAAWEHPLSHWTGAALDAVHPGLLSGLPDRPAATVLQADPHAAPRAGAAESVHAAPDGAHADGACTLCLAYAALAFASPALTGFAMAAESGSLRPPASAAPAIGRQAVDATRIRGPPQGTI